MSTAEPSGVNAPAEEMPLEPERRIIDPHLHLWDHGRVPGTADELPPFLLSEALRTIEASGHRVTHTVYVECYSMYRQEGPSELRSVGEVEFANGAAAMAASGRYGSCRVAAGIVGSADLNLGERVMPVLEALIAAGNGRLRGIRTAVAYAEAGMFGRPADPAAKGLMKSPSFRKGAAILARFGLTLDVWCFHTQLQELADLASACPGTTVILDHLGSPLYTDRNPFRDAQVFTDWRAGMVELARRPNVRVKLSGLGLDYNAPLSGRPGSGRSSELAQDWRPFIETCISAFGPQRCMFESNFPPDNALCSYGALWNAFKRVTAGCSNAEKALLFSDVAAEVYRLE